MSIGTLVDSNARRRRLLRRNAGVIAAGALLVATTTALGATLVSQHAATTGLQARAGALQHHLDVARRTHSEQVSQNETKVLGFSQSRVDEDTATITSLVRTAFTWSTGAGYEQARTRLKSRFGLTENDVFLTAFMPPSRFNQDSSGRRYYYIDAEGLTSALTDDPDVQVVKVVADDYTYAVQIDASAGSGAGASTAASRRVLMLVTIDAAGHLSNLSADPAGGATRNSG